MPPAAANYTCHTSPRATFKDRAHCTKPESAMHLADFYVSFPVSASGENIVQTAYRISGTYLYTCHFEEDDRSPPPTPRATSRGRRLAAGASSSAQVRRDWPYEPVWLVLDASRPVWGDLTSERSHVSILESMWRTKDFSDAEVRCAASAVHEAEVGSFAAGQARGAARASIAAAIALPPLDANSAGGAAGPQRQRSCLLDRAARLVHAAREQLGAGTPVGAGRSEKIEMRDG